MGARGKGAAFEPSCPAQHCRGKRRFGNILRGAFTAGWTNAANCQGSRSPSGRSAAVNGRVGRNVRVPEQF